MGTKTNTAEQEKQRIAVVKFGGSFATNPDSGEIQPDYFEKFFSEFASVLIDRYAKIGLIVGGGPKVRREQRAAGDISSPAKDRLAKVMMHKNAETLRWMAGDYGLNVAPRVPKNENEAKALAYNEKYNTVSLSWLKEGQSSDASAVYLLTQFTEALSQTTDPEEIELLAMILSNVLFIYTADPHAEAEAKAISFATFPALIKGGILSKYKKDFKPGMSVTIDPVAVHNLLALEKKGHVPVVYYTEGRSSNFRSVRSILEGRPFDKNHPRVGTRIRGGIKDDIIHFYKNPAKRRKQVAR